MCLTMHFKNTTSQVSAPQQGGRSGAESAHPTSGGRSGAESAHPTTGGRRGAESAHPNTGGRSGAESAHPTTGGRSGACCQIPFVRIYKAIIPIQGSHTATSWGYPEIPPAEQIDREYICCDELLGHFLFAISLRCELPSLHQLQQKCQC